MLFATFPGGIIPGTITVSSGTGSFNTPKFSMGYLRQLIVSPTTSTNIYDIQIIDPTGLLVLPTEDLSTYSLVGTFNMHKLDIPFVGIYTVKILNAVIDEVFNYKMVVQED